MGSDTQDFQPVGFSSPADFQLPVGNIFCVKRLFGNATFKQNAVRLHGAIAVRLHGANAV